MIIAIGRRMCRDVPLHAGFWWHWTHWCQVELVDWRVGWGIMGQDIPMCSRSAEAGCGDTQAPYGHMAMWSGSQTGSWPGSQAEMPSPARLALHRPRLSFYPGRLA